MDTRIRMKPDENTFTMTAGKGSAFTQSRTVRFNGEISKMNSCRKDKTVGFSWINQSKCSVGVPIDRSYQAWKG